MPDNDAPNDHLGAWLHDFLARHGAVAGTVHVVRDDLLQIAAAVNIPAKVQEVTARIPLGKGMAGLAWERDEPVSTCNLKEDASGAVKPGARAVDAKAAVAIPVHGGDGVRGVVGVAWSDERDLPAAMLDQLGRDAETMP
jgi:L-methionine (R)-S-oxide reductase